MVGIDTNCLVCKTVFIQVSCSFERAAMLYRRLKRNVIVMNPELQPRISYITDDVAEGNMHGFRLIAVTSNIASFILRLTAACCKLFYKNK